MTRIGLNLVSTAILRPYLKRVAGCLICAAHALLWRNSLLERSEAKRDTLPSPLQVITFGNLHGA